MPCVYPKSKTWLQREHDLDYIQDTWCPDYTGLLLIIKVFSRLFTHLTERRSKHKPQPNNTHIWVQTQFNYKRLHWNITFFKPIKSFSSIMNIKHLNRHQPLYRATVDTGQSSVMKQKVMLYWAVMRQTDRT